jgi:hypothetical protein
VPQTEWVAHSDDPIANALLRAVAESQIGHRFPGVDFEHRQVRPGVAAGNFRRIGIAIIQSRGDVMGAIDNMVVCYDVARRIDDEAGTQGSDGDVSLHVRAFDAWFIRPPRDDGEHLRHRRAHHQARYATLLGDAVRHQLRHRHHHGVPVRHQPG